MSDAETIMARIEAKLDAALETQREHHRTLYGDGTGLAYVVPRVEQSQRECPARKAYSAEGRGLVEQVKGNWLSLIALAVAIVALILDRA